MQVYEKVRERERDIIGEVNMRERIDKSERGLLLRERNGRK